MHNFEKKFGELVIQYRWLVIIGCLLLVAFMASGGKHLSMTTNYRVFFSADNPQRMAFEALEATYAKNDNVMFVIAPEDGVVFTKPVLEAIYELTHKAWQTPYSSRVDSLTNYQHTEAEGDDLLVEDLVEDPALLTTERLAYIKNIAVNEPLLLHRLISDSAHVTAVNVTVQLPGIDETTETPEVVAHARKLAAEIEAKYPFLKIYMTGMVMMNNGFSEASLNDMTSLIPISFLVMMIMLFLMIRGFSGTVLTMIVIILSVMSAMGAGGHIGYPITPPSATAPTVILTVAIANSVHVLVSFYHYMREGMAKIEAMVESLRVNLQPVFLTSLTTSIGFLSMNFSDVPPFNHLGNFVAIGVGMSFLLAVAFLPAVISLLPVKVRVRHEKGDRLMIWLGDFVVNNKRLLLPGMALLVVVLVSFLPRNELNDVFVEYFDESIQFRQATDFTVENLTGMYLIDFSVESAEPGGISDPEFQQEVEDFANWFRSQPETIHVNVYTDIMKRLNRNMHGDNNKMYRLPGERNLAAQYLLMYEMSLPYGLDLNNQINVDKSATRMIVTLQTLSTNQLIELEKRSDQWLVENASYIKAAAASGPTMMFAHIGKRNIISMLAGTTIALILISLIMVIALRSFKLGLTSMVPNLVPAAMGFGIWGIFVGEVGLGLSVVTSMTLGIVVDDTVHYMSKYRRARVEKGYDPEQAVRYAFTSVGRALLVTSVVLIAGFLVLSFSAFRLNSDMGLLTALVIALALLADFLLLPPLLMKIEGKSNEKNTAASTA
ncbi:MAG: efflux RND transporter permease subunit [Arenicellales bacterium]